MVLILESSRSTTKDPIDILRFLNVHSVHYGTCLGPVICVMMLYDLFAIRVAISHLVVVDALMMMTLL